MRGVNTKYFSVFLFFCVSLCVSDRVGVENSLDLRKKDDIVGGDVKVETSGESTQNLKTNDREHELSASDPQKEGQLVRSV